ncbi:TrkA C-terminal domain-containing protein [Mycoplasmopsis synoviae]
MKDLYFPAMGVTVVLVRRNGQTYQITGDFVLKENDQVSIVGKIPSVNSVYQWLNSVN